MQCSFTTGKVRPLVFRGKDFQTNPCRATDAFYARNAPIVERQHTLFPLQRVLRLEIFRHGPRARLGPFHARPDAVRTRLKIPDPAGGRGGLAVLGRKLGLMIVVQRDIRVAVVFPRGGYDGFRIIHVVRSAPVPAGKCAERQELYPFRRAGGFRGRRGQRRGVAGESFRGAHAPVLQAPGGEETPGTGSGAALPGCRAAFFASCRSGLNAATSKSGCL